MSGVEALICQIFCYWIWLFFLFILFLGVVHSVTLTYIEACKLIITFPLHHLFIFFL